MYTSVCGRFSVWKKMCETFEFVCVRVSFAVAAVNGKRQPSLATKSVSHALALQPLPSQPRLCRKCFFSIVLLHGTAVGVEETTTGALHFFSLFNNPESLVAMVDVGPGHSSRISAPPSPNPELDC